ncbi:MAG: tetratricopeptide repeat protein [Myxococcota bacterium]
MRRAFLHRLAAAAVCLAVGTACQTPGSNEYDVEERLEDLLARWETVREHGWTCEEDAPRETPIVDCERIRRDLERLALEFPRSVPVLLANAVIAQQTDRPARSQMYLNALFAIEAVHPDAAVLRARLALRDGNLRFARRLVDEQIELTPDHAGLREVRAAVCYLSGDLEGAQRDLAAAASLGSPASRVAYHEGLVSEAAGRLDEARDHYARALELDADAPRAASRLRGLEVDWTRRAVP